MIGAAHSRVAFYRVNLGIPLLLALLVLLVFDMTHLDRFISDLFYDSSNAIFPLGESRLFEKLTHKWPRIIPDWTGELSIIAALLSFIWPPLQKYQERRWFKWMARTHVLGVLQLTHRYRLDFFFLIVAFAISTGAIHFLKSHTGIYCPVETTLYGGSQIHREWFENFSLWGEAGPGRCWPAGHASSAFSLFALYFIARRYRWRYSRLLLIGVTVLGFIYGTTRVLQGWHFMSHTFWAGIVVWLSTLLVALCMYGRSALQQPCHPGGQRSLPTRVDIADVRQELKSSASAAPHH